MIVVSVGKTASLVVLVNVLNVKPVSICISNTDGL
jgi:hypothetical protein